MKSSGLTVVKHHEQLTCPKKDELIDKATLDIQCRLEKWEKIKSEKKNGRTFCPYGCGKSWKASSINNNSVRAHLLGGGRTKCPKFPSDGKTLLKQFYTKKRRSSFADYIS